MSDAFLFQAFFDQALGMNRNDLHIGYSFPFWLSERGWNEYIHALKQVYFKLKAAIPEKYQDAHALLHTKYPLSFEEFLLALKGEFGTLDIPSAFRKGEREDYLRYLLHSHSEAKAWFRQGFRFFLPGTRQRAHTYIVGESGSGKSVLLFAIFSSMLHRRWKHQEKRSLIVIDPHGSLAEKCARSELLFKEDLALAEKRKNARFHSSRPSFLPGNFLPPTWWEAKDLVYLDPSLGVPSAFVTVNPLDIEGRNYDPIQRDTYVGRVVHAFTSLLSPGDSPLTIQMSALLTPCIAVLLHRPGSTFRDLKRFMDDSQNSDLVSLGSRSPNEEHRHFFSFLFATGTYTQTKRSIATKLQMLLNDELFQRFIAGGPSTFDLEAAMNSGKVVIVNLSCFSDEYQEASMRLLVAMTLGIAKARKVPALSSTPHLTPVDLLIDEAELALSSDIKDILTQARKFGLYLTLAQQVAGQGMSPSLETIVLGNTPVKIVGQSGYHTRQKMARELLCSPRDFDDLGKGLFVMKAGEYPWFRMGIDEKFASDELLISHDAFKRVIEHQLSLYYRKPGMESRRMQGQQPVNNPHSFMSTRHQSSIFSSTQSSTHIHSRTQNHSYHQNCLPNQTGSHSQDRMLLSFQEQNQSPFQEQNKTPLHDQNHTLIQTQDDTQDQYSDPTQDQTQSQHSHQPQTQYSDLTQGYTQTNTPKYQRSPFFQVSQRKDV